MKAYVEIRSQKARGRFPRSGPDMYVAVQIVPDGAERMKVLRYSVAKKRGIEVRHIGEGYSAHQGPKSRLGQAIAEANRVAASINEGAKQ